MAKAHVGILVCGTMGEAHHLSPEERIAVIKATREALDGAGFHSAFIIAGTGVGSTRETIARTEEAAAAGADYSIVIPPGYFAAALGHDRKALKEFFKDVSEASPIPVMVYNCRSFLVTCLYIQLQLTDSCLFVQIPVRLAESTWKVT